MGPITDWWFEGFDLNEESSIGFTTEMGHYYLMKPMREYAPFMTSVKEKIFVAKTVIDIVEKTTGEEDLSFDGLVESLKVKHRYSLNLYSVHSRIDELVCMKPINRIIRG